MNMESRKNSYRFFLMFTLILFATSAVSQQTQTARSAEKDAGWGAFGKLTLF
jgi:hypothetical protein